MIIPPQIARDFGLREGAEVEGLSRDGGNGRRTLVEVTKVGGRTPDEYKVLPHFQDLVSINPSEAFELAGEQAETPLRVMDLLTPIGKGSAA